MATPTVQNAQALRFAAAGLVLMGHLQHEAVDYGMMAREWSPIAWAFGVDIFFVISGFVMFLSSADGFGAAGASRLFLLRRLIRIVPIYWLFTTLTLVAMAVGLMAGKATAVPHIIASYLFIPWPRPGDGVLGPVLGLGWTLNYEMFFYVVFGTALLMPKRRGVAFVVGLFLFLAAIYPLVPPRFFVLAYWSNRIILEFLMGIGIAALYRRGVRLPVLVAIPLALAAPFFVPESDNIRFLSWGIPAAVIVACATLIPELPNRRAREVASLLGGASYALYLSHPFVVNLVGVVLRKLGLDSAILFMLIAALASIGGSIVIHLAIEKPVGGWLKRRLIPSRAPAGPPDAVQG